MAYRGYQTDVSPDFDMGGNVVCTEGAIRHDPDLSPPRVIVMMRLKASSGSGRSIAGTLYLDAEYTDGTVDNLQTQATAVSAIGAERWYAEHSGATTNQDLTIVHRRHGDTPWNNDDFPSGAGTYFNLSATKTLKRIRVDWRPS